MAPTKRLRILGTAALAALLGPALLLPLTTPAARAASPNAEDSNTQLGTVALHEGGTIRQRQGSVHQSFETASICRGLTCVQRIGSPRRTGKHIVQPWTSLEEHVVEHAYGTEQQWHFDTEPEGAGPLEVRVAWAETGAPRHYGPATWVDRAGTRTPLRTVGSAFGVTIHVPDAVLRESGYPAVLDPIVDTEQRLSSSQYAVEPEVLDWGSVTAVNDDFWAFGSFGHTFGSIMTRIERIGPDGSHLDDVPILLGRNSGGAHAVFHQGKVVVVWNPTLSTIALQRFLPDGSRFDAAPHLVASIGGSSISISDIGALNDTLYVTAHAYFGGNQVALGNPHQLLMIDVNTLVSTSTPFGFIEPAVSNFGNRLFAGYHEGSPDFQFSVREIDPSGTTLTTYDLGPDHLCTGLAATNARVYGAYRQGSSGLVLNDVLANDPPLNFGDLTGLTPSPPACGVPIAARGNEVGVVADGILHRVRDHVVVASEPLAYVNAPPQPVLGQHRVAFNEQNSVAVFQAEQGPLSTTLAIHPENGAPTATSVSRWQVPQRVNQLTTDGNDAVATWRSASFLGDEEFSNPLANTVSVGSRLVTAQGLGFLSEAPNTVARVVGARASGGWFSYDFSVPNQIAMASLTRHDIAADGSVTPVAVDMVGFGHQLELTRIQTGYMLAFPATICPLSLPCATTLNVHRLDANGAFTEAFTPIELTAPTEGATSTNLAAGSRNTRDDVLVVWEEISGGSAALTGVVVGGPAPTTPSLLIPTIGEQTQPFVFGLADGWYVVWSNLGHTGRHIFGQHLDEDLKRVGNVTQLTANTAARSPHLSDAKDGRHLVLVWSGAAADGPPDIYMQLIDATTFQAVPDSTQLLVTGDFGAYHPKLVTLAEGDSILAYSRVTAEAGSLGTPQAMVRRVSVTFPDGDTCTDDLDCGSEHCIDGICCSEACGTCETCAADGASCDTLTDVAVDGCNGEFRCGANGSCLPVDGSQCTSNDECASNFCVDGICCNRACDGSCDQCRTGTCESLNCDGYACQPSEQGRACRETCQDTSECEPGYQCNAGRACVAITPQTDIQDDGCGCRVVGSASLRDGETQWRDRAFGFAAWLALAMAHRRRRKAR